MPGPEIEITLKTVADLTGSDKVKGALKDVREEASRNTDASNVAVKGGFNAPEAATTTAPTTTPTPTPTQTITETKKAAIQQPAPVVAKPPTPTVEKPPTGEWWENDPTITDDIKAKIREDIARESRVSKPKSTSTSTSTIDSGATPLKTDLNGVGETPDFLAVVKANAERTRAAQVKINNDLQAKIAENIKNRPEGGELPKVEVPKEAVTRSKDEEIERRAKIAEDNANRMVRDALSSGQVTKERFASVTKEARENIGIPTVKPEDFGLPAEIVKEPKREPSFRNRLLGGQTETESVNAAKDFQKLLDKQPVTITPVVDLAKAKAQLEELRIEQQKIKDSLGGQTEAESIKATAGFRKLLEAEGTTEEVKPEDDTKKQEELYKLREQQQKKFVAAEKKHQQDLRNARRPEPEEHESNLGEIFKESGKEALGLVGALVGVNVGLGAVQAATEFAKEAFKALVETQEDALQSTKRLNAAYGEAAAGYQTFIASVSKGPEAFSEKDISAGVTALKPLKQELNLTTKDTEELIRTAAKLADIQEIPFGDALNALQGSLKGNSGAADALGLSLSGLEVSQRASNGEFLASYGLLTNAQKAHLVLAEAVKQVGEQFKNTEHEQDSLFRKQNEAAAAQLALNKAIGGGAYDVAIAGTDLYTQALNRLARAINEVKVAGGKKTESDTHAPTPAHAPVVEKPTTVEGPQTKTDTHGNKDVVLKTPEPEPEPVHKPEPEHKVETKAEPPTEHKPEPEHKVEVTKPPTESKPEPKPIETAKPEPPKVEKPVGGAAVQATIKEYSSEVGAVAGLAGDVVDAANKLPGIVKVMVPVVGAITAYKDVLEIAQDKTEQFGKVAGPAFEKTKQESRDLFSAIGQGIDILGGGDNPILKLLNPAIPLLKAAKDGVKALNDELALNTGDFNLELPDVNETRPKLQSVVTGLREVKHAAEDTGPTLVKIFADAAAEIGNASNRAAAIRGAVQNISALNPAQTDKLAARDAAVAIIRQKALQAQTKDAEQLEEALQKAYSTAPTSGVAVAIKAELDILHSLKDGYKELTEAQQESNRLRLEGAQLGAQTARAQLGALAQNRAVEDKQLEMQRNQFVARDRSVSPQERAQARRDIRAETIALPQLQTRAFDANAPQRASQRQEEVNGLMLRIANATEAQKQQAVDVTVTLSGSIDVGGVTIPVSTAEHGQGGPGGITAAVQVVQNQAKPTLAGAGH